ncbi:NAD-dependent epimerase/dehydratase family protein [Candidatus Parcubacteria bacterium]|jgi:nucleoside-diphosphate-sugar epimerase|nr:MAG: NAD-dependent epimerase/dehydratase family protein [Candidatus Parcubacteria bacterium]
MTSKRPIFESNNILVAGGAGFLGSHLCDELAKNNKVICVDNFSSGSIENINHLLQKPNFKFIKHDLSEPIDLEKFPELRPFKVAFQGVQEIYNFACPTSPKEYTKLPIETLLANAFASKHLLDLAVKYEAKYLFASSSAIYGEPVDSQPFREDYWGFIDPIGPRSCYNEGKRFAESLTVNYRLHNKVDAKVVRIFNTYGPRMRLTDGRLIPDLVNSALKGEPLKIYGKADVASTFCYVVDMVDGLLKTMKSKEAGPINLGSPDAVPLAEVAEKILALTQSTSSIEHVDAHPFSHRQGVPDIRLAKEVLGWFPTIPLADGLTETIEAMKASRVISYQPEE